MGIKIDPNPLMTETELRRFAEVRLRVQMAESQPSPAKRAPKIPGVGKVTPDHQDFIVQELTNELTKAHAQYQEVVENNQRLMESARINSDFLANMSHELRSPLNSVIGFSEVLLDQAFGPINEKQREYISHIMSSGRHLLAVINDILDLSKVESGVGELELNDFSLRTALDDSVMMLREKAFKGGITLNLNLSSPADIRIVADQRKLKRIMFNLLSNAIRYTATGGTVNVSAVREDDFIEITVADTGLGIKVEKIPNLFQIPSQTTEAGGPDDKKDEGGGLGLVLTRQLVELHGGRIWVKSYFGMGSRFTFTLPHPRGKAVTTPAIRSNIARDTGKIVLLIEDEALTLAATENALHDKGYRVLQAKDGEEGIELARRNRPDLIVLDLMLPGINGFDVVDRLRREHEVEKVPILILTSMRIVAADRARLKGKVWKITEKGSLSTHEFINLVESAVGTKTEPS